MSSSNKYQIPLLKFFRYDKSTATWTCQEPYCGATLETSERMHHMRYAHPEIYNYYKELALGIIA